MPNRKQKSIRNFKFGFLNKIVTVIGPFVLRTIMIKQMGSNYLGLSSLFTSVLQVLSLSELGIGSAMVFGLYKPIAEKDYKKVSELQKIYQIVYKIIGIVIFVLGLCVMPFLKFMIKGTIPSDVSICILYLLYLANTSLSYGLFSYKASILSANQRRDIISNISTIVHIVLYVSQSIIILVYKNYYLYVISLLVCTILESIITYIYVSKNYHYSKPSKNFDKVQFRELLKNVKNLFGHKLSIVVTNSVDTIVISSFLGLNMVTVYNNYYYLMSAVFGILDIVYQGILAGIGNSLISETLQKNEKDFYNFVFLNSWLIGFCTICYLCLFQPFIALWVGEINKLHFSSVILLSIYFYVLKIRQIILLYKDASGLWEVDKFKPYVEIITNLALNILLVQLIGINGIIISTIVSILFVSIPWETAKTLKSVFNTDSSKYIKDSLLYLLVTIVNAVIVYATCNMVNISGLFGIIIKGIICIFLSNLIYCACYFCNGHFKSSIKYFRK